VEKVDAFFRQTFEAVRLFFREGADILWFEDPNQNVRDTDAVALRDQGFVGYCSLLNFSSPIVTSHRPAPCGLPSGWRRWAPP